MSKFRKKPVVIDAVQFTYKNWMVLNDFADMGRLEDGKPERVREGSDFFLMIPTLEGVMKAEHGDWVIKGVKGELYPCKADIFEATYEPVE